MVPVEHRATVDYAITAAIAVALPLFVATLTGHGAEGALVGLGAFMVANSAFQGPYGLRARYLFATVAAIGAGTTVGALVNGHPWLAVVVVTVAVGIGVCIPRVGMMWALATLLAAVRPPVRSIPIEVLLMIVGGLWLTLLFLVPWPHRRLRPFRVAATETAEAMAALLEAVTEPEETWEERRRAATEALKRTRTACGLYPVGCDSDEESTLEWLVVALAGVLHEVVALRAVVEALREHSLEPLPEQVVGPMIQALAERMRRLGKAIEMSHRADLAEPDPSELRDVAERVEELRQVALVDRQDPLTAALLDHIRLAADRLAAAIDSAEKIVAAGIKLGLTVPSPPDPRDLAEFWRTLTEDLKSRSLRFRRLTRTAVATAVGMVAWVVQPFPHGYWLPITVLVCMRFSYGETETWVVQRIGGSAAGAVLGAVLLALAPGKVTLVIWIFISALVAYALRSISYVFWTTFNTPLVMMLVDYSTPVDWRVAGERIALTVAGGLIAVASARLFWPSSGHDAMLLDRLAAMCESYADLVRAVAAKIDGADMPMDERFTESAESAHDVTESVQRLAEEPQPDDERVEALRDVIAAAHRIHDDLITVTRLSGEDSVDAGPVSAILDRIAERLEGAARELRAGHMPAVAELDLDAQFSELDDFLATLAHRRRAEMASGADPGDSSPLRRTLTHTAAIRHALHDLRADVEDLLRALQRAGTAA